MQQRKALLSISAVLVWTALIWFLANVGLGDIGRIDLLQYWSAARSSLNSQNPYDPSVLLRIQQEVVPEAPVVRMWNPPLVLTLVFWFAFLKFEVLQSLWFFISLFLIFVSCQLTLSGIGREQSREKVVLLLIFSLTFYPFYASIDYGQISPLILLGFVGFCFRGEGVSSPLNRAFSGLWLALVLVKPHLLYLVFLYLIGCTFREGSFSWIKGFLIGLFILALFPLFISTDVYWFYLQAIKTPPIEFATPTLGSWFQQLAGYNSALLRALPSTVLGLLLVIGMLFFYKASYSRNILLVLTSLSLVTSPYGWVYDQMLLVPLAYWLILSSSSWIIPGVLIAANLIVCVTAPGTGQQWYFWYPIILGILGWRKLYGEKCLSKTI